jgi:hypothetical protein
MISHPASKGALKCSTASPLATQNSEAGSFLQLDSVGDLQVLVFGRNRDLLSGTVRTLVVTAKDVVYQVSCDSDCRQDCRSVP